MKVEFGTESGGVEVVNWEFTVWRTSQAEIIHLIYLNLEIELVTLCRREVF